MSFAMGVVELVDGYRGVVLSGQSENVVLSASSVAVVLVLCHHGMDSVVVLSPPPSHQGLSCVVVVLGALVVPTVVSSGPHHHGLSCIVVVSGVLVVVGNASSVVVLRTLTVVCSLVLSQGHKYLLVVVSKAGVADVVSV